MGDLMQSQRLGIVLPPCLGVAFDQAWDAVDARVSTTGSSPGYSE